MFLKIEQQKVMSVSHQLTKYDVKLSENWDYVKSVWRENEQL